MAKNKDERQIMVDIILHRKLKTTQHEHHKKGVNSVATEGKLVPAPLVATIVLLLSNI